MLMLSWIIHTLDSFHLHSVVSWKCARTGMIFDIINMLKHNTFNEVQVEDFSLCFHHRENNVALRLRLADIVEIIVTISICMIRFQIYMQNYTPDTLNKKSGTTLLVSKIIKNK